MNARVENGKFSFLVVDGDFAARGVENFWLDVFVFTSVDRSDGMYVTRVNNDLGTSSAWYRALAGALQ